MTRGVSAAMQAAIEAGTVRIALFHELFFDSGTWRTWTGYNSITYNGSTWLGVGDLMQFEPAQETAELAALGGTLTLTGVPPSDVARALAEPYQRRKAKLYITAYDGAGVIIDPPLEVMSGLMDTMTFSDGPQPTIQLTVESRLLELKTPRGRRYTDQDQKTDHPADEGLSEIRRLLEYDIPWGRR